MPIAFRCTCGARLEADEDAAGTRIECQKCGEQVVVPEGDGLGVELQEDAGAEAGAAEPSAPPAPGEPAAAPDEPPKIEAAEVRRKPRPKKKVQDPEPTDDGRPRCEVCGVPYRIGDPLCTGCGVNLETWQWSEALQGPLVRPFDSRIPIGAGILAAIIIVFFVVRAVLNYVLAEWAYESAVVALKDDDLDLAAEEFGNCLSHDPGRVVALAQFAEVELRRGQFDHAMELAEETLDREPRSDEGRLARFVRGMVKRERRDFEGAAEDLEDARELNPCPVDLLGALADCLVALNQRDAADDFYRQAVEEGEAALQAPRDRYVPPDLSQIIGSWRRARAHLRLDANDPTGALDILVEIPESSRGIEGWRLMGDANRALQRWRDAARAYQQVVQIDGHDLRGLLMLGLVRNRLTPPNHEAALEVLQQALDLVSPEETNLRARIQKEMGNAHVGRAWRARADGQTQEAAALAEQAVAELRDARPVLSSDREVSLLLGDAYALADNFREARGAYEQAAQSPDLALTAREHWGRMELEGNRNRLAAEQFEMIPAEQRSGEVWYFLGRAKLGDGNAGAAREAFTQARRLLPDDVRPTYDLADIMFSMSETQQALDLLGDLATRGLEPARAHLKMADYRRRSAQMTNTAADWDAVARECQAVLDSVPPPTDAQRTQAELWKHEAEVNRSLAQ